MVTLALLVTVNREGCLRFLIKLWRGERSSPFWMCDSLDSPFLKWRINRKFDYLVLVWYMTSLVHSLN